MDRFLADFEAGRHEERYVAGELPALPFADFAFDLAVCSHFLFLYSEQLSEQFHVESLRNLMRVATEARIFPLLELGGKPSRHVDEVRMTLRDDGHRVEIEVVNYEVVAEIDETPFFVSVILPPDAGSFVVPSEIIALGDEIKFEVLVREASYNQTGVESCFIVE